MASKSGEILTDKEVDNTSQDSDVIENDIYTSKFPESPSSENSTLTQTVDLEEEEEEVLDSGCCTPREFIFDPFAPAPEQFCVAPMRKNINADETSPIIHYIHFKEEVVDCSGCSTPPELIFDPFAAGKDKLCLAPKRKSNPNPPRRQLRHGFDLSPSFDLEGEFDEFEKGEIRNVCESFVDLIISDALEICELKMLLTPTEMPSNNVIANTCPGAPMRPSLKIPTDVKCVMPRKLNFDLDLE